MQSDRWLIELMELKIALAVASVIPMAAVSVWLTRVFERHRDSAKFRHRIAVRFLILGFVATLAFVWLALVTWGSPEAFWVMTLLFSGQLSIAVSGGMGLVNLLILKRSGANPSLFKDF